MRELSSTQKKIVAQSQTESSIGHGQVGRFHATSSHRRGDSFMCRSLDHNSFSKNRPDPRIFPHVPQVIQNIIVNQSASGARDMRPSFTGAAKRDT